MKNRLDHYPTANELRALELAAHRARSQELLRLIRSATAGLKAFVGRLTPVAHGEEGVGHA